MRIFSAPAFAVARDEGGSPAVEFALAAPVLLLLMAAIVEFGTIMFVTVLMEGVCARRLVGASPGRRRRTGIGPRTFSRSSPTGRWVSST